MDLLHSLIDSFIVYWTKQHCPMQRERENQRHWQTHDSCPKGTYNLGEKVEYICKWCDSEEWFSCCRRLEGKWQHCRLKRPGNDLSEAGIKEQVDMVKGRRDKCVAGGAGKEWGQWKMSPLQMELKATMRSQAGPTAWGWRAQQCFYLFLSASFSHLPQQLF